MVLLYSHVRCPAPMEESSKFETKIPKDSFANIACGQCDRSTRHQVLSEATTHWEDRSVGGWVAYQLVQCQGCLTVSFCEASSCSEDVDYDDSGTAYYPVTRKLYPSRIAGRPMMREAHLLPHGVYAIYEEAHGALCAELRVMAGFGIRAIVEAVCKDKGMTGQFLQDKIDSLAVEGFITKAGTKILHSLRFMGNAAAHEMKSHSPTELNAAFDVVEHLMYGVYVLPKQADQLPDKGG